jgi:uncharacterized protein (TIGR03435 family)
MNSMLSRRILPALLAFGVLAPIAAAQTGADSNSFDVASVKTGDPSFRGMSMHVGPSGLSVTNVTLKFLIQYAWDVKKFQVSGGPGWIDSDLFTIAAKSDHGQDVDFEQAHSEKYKAFTERLHLKVRSLLADRFALRLHREQRVMPVYELVVAGSGPKLSPAADGPEGLTSGPGRLKGTRVRTSAIASALSDATERVVIDRTGLNGYYDYSLTWTPDMASGAEPQASERGGVSLFTAVQEQLGLKLKAAKGPVEVLAIDGAEKPSAN